MANFNISTKKILSASNIKRIIMLGISLRDELNSVELGLISDYDNTKTYTRGQAVYYNNYLYKCLYTTTGDFDESKWQLIGDDLDLVTKADIEAMLGLTQDQLDTLASIILDSEVRLDKTWSSSKIYTDLQQCLSDSKKFTLDQFAKANKASYQVITNLSSATDKSIIYLMANGSNYDMYIVESDGTPTKIGDTTIDLSQFYTKTEIDNDFVKKTDADGKYALITTVDKKAEKTDLDNHINDTDIHVTTSDKTKWNNKIDKNTSIKLNDLPNGSYCEINSFFQDNNEFITLDIVKSDGKINRLELTNAGDIINHVHYDGSNWTILGRVCTTSVKDVETTTIKPTFPSTVKLGKTQMIRYSIKNGWANVAVIMNLSASPKLDWTTIATGLPKPDKEVNTSSFGETAVNNAGVGFRLNTNGILEMLIGSEITQSDWWNVNFSYPVLG